MKQQYSRQAHQQMDTYRDACVYIAQCHVFTALAGTEIRIYIILYVYKYIYICMYDVITILLYSIIIDMHETSNYIIQHTF